MRRIGRVLFALPLMIGACTSEGPTSGGESPCWVCEASTQRPARIEYDAIEVMGRLAGQWRGTVAEVGPLRDVEVTLDVSTPAAPAYGVLEAPAGCVVRPEDQGRCDGLGAAGAVAVHTDQPSFGDEKADLQVLGAALSCPLPATEGCPFVEIERSLAGTGYTLVLAFDDADRLWARTLGPDAASSTEFERIGAQVE